MPRLIVSDKKGRISAHPVLRATGMEGANIRTLDLPNLVKLPPGSRLFMLPSRSPVGYDFSTGQFRAVTGLFAASAFLAPGFTAELSASFIPVGSPDMLPLFSYAAACYHKGNIYAAATRTDRDIRHDCRYMDTKEVKKHIRRISKLLPGNRLIGHLKGCALVYGCPNAQNFFLGRFEAPLPTSPACNASCLGCISYQPGKKCPASQPRISFVPTAGEIAEIALMHIDNVRDAIVSFGQGCEGEPLLQVRLIERSIRLIRKVTSRGTIHLNTNGSMPVEIDRLIDAGLNSVRISMNSCRASYYSKYYKPSGYSFGDVSESAKKAKKKGVFVSINYLTMPGFTDTVDEFNAMRRFISFYNIDMIQWRNLNYDPLAYFDDLGFHPKPQDILGIKFVIDSLKKEFPRVRMGYFNPSLVKG